MCIRDSYYSDRACEYLLKSLQQTVRYGINIRNDSAYYIAVRSRVYIFQRYTLELVESVCS